MIGQSPLERVPVADLHSFMRGTLDQGNWVTPVTNHLAVCGLCISVNTGRDFGRLRGDPARRPAGMSANVEFRSYRLAVLVMIAGYRRPVVIAAAPRDGGSRTG